MGKIYQNIVKYSGIYGYMLDSGYIQLYIRIYNYKLLYGSYQKPIFTRCWLAAARNDWPR